MKKEDRDGVKGHYTGVSGCEFFLSWRLFMVFKGFLEPRPFYYEGNVTYIGVAVRNTRN
jgi:hypothetical protein